MACRYVYHALRNSKHTVATIDEADVVYVYDYCYMMWILSDHHAREHWWLRDNYTPERKTGSHLLSVYRCAPLSVDSPIPCRALYIYLHGAPQVSSFATDTGHRLLPMSFRRIPGLPNEMCSADEGMRSPLSSPALAVV